MLDLKKLLAKALTTLKGLAYTNDSTVYQNYCKARRVGRVVNLWGVSDGTYNIPAGSYTSLTTLPTQFRPDHNVTDVVEPYGDGTNQVTIHIRPDGIVQLFSPQGTTWWRYNVTYIVGG